MIKLHCWAERQAAGLAGTRYGYDADVDGEAWVRAADLPATSVRDLRDQLRSTLAPFVKGERSCALVDFPDHSNVGDSAIWLGAISWLSDAGLRIGYRCDAETYNPDHLGHFVPTGPIFINGGGNFGDVWRRHQRLREAVITDFRDRPIVQLPQTLHFQRAENLAAARQLFDAHPNLTLLVRDCLSLNLVRSEFRATSGLCPDMAFYIGQLDRVVQPDVDILWLRREDRETSGASGPVPSDVLACDWLDNRVPMLRRARNVLRPLAAREPGRRFVLARALAAAYDQQARQRLRAGCNLLSRGRVVITDRLHAHILCLLLRIPHVLLDNSYGKVRRVHETWTAGASGVRWAASASEAIAVARSLLKP